MVRFALIALLLVPFLASSAGASRIDATRAGAHASIRKSNVHRVHRPVHPVSHSTRTTSHATQTAARRNSAHRNVRQPAVSSRTTRRPAYSSRRATTLRRTRYSANHARARFTPLATVPVSQRERQLQPEAETASNTATAADTAKETGSAVSSFSEAGSSEPSADTAGGDTALPPGVAPASAAAVGNPLAAPPAASPAVASDAGQVAELHLPRFPQNLHINNYALRGTHDSLVRQNERSEEEALERIEDDADLQDRIARGTLVRVPESVALSVNPELPDDRRYCRPWTANFLTDLSRAHNSVFHKPLVVSSAVRTVEYQKRLMRTNHNAADAEGDVVSPHLTGATIDIAKSGLSRKEMQWMRNELLAYQNAGLIDVEEEFRQRCFHITVYKNYDSASPRKPATNAVTPAAPASLPAGPGDTTMNAK